jgi:surfeit locus 1 family protein
MSETPPAPSAARVSRARRPAWIPLAATIAVVVVCVAAGNWQRGRMYEKEALGAALAAADQAAPIALPARADDWSAWRYRRVVVRGRYDAATQFLLDNRVRDGRVGYEVITPLAIPDGSYVLVDRGFVAAGRDRATLPDVPPPRGDVEIEGRVELPRRSFFGGDTPPQGLLWAHLDPDRYAWRTGRQVLPVYVQATTPGDGSDGLDRAWQKPDLGIEKHLGYAVQWYTFAALAAGLWLYFTLRGLRR